MNKVRAVLVLLCLFVFSPIAYADISVFVNEKEVVFDDQPPVVVEGRTFVPLRKIFEELGASVDWIGETNTVYASKRFSVLTFSVGDSKYSLNGEEKLFDAPPFSLNNRVLIPVRAVSEALGADVEWIKDENKVSISLNEGEYPIKDCYINGAKTHDDGTVLMTYRAAYPEIISENDVCAAFNEFIKGDAEEAVARGVSECLESAKQTYSVSVSNGDEFVPYMSEHTFVITYNDYNIISVLCSDCNFSGGFHPSYALYSMTYNLETGEMMDIEQILDKKESVIREEVYNLFLSNIEQNPQEYYDDAIDCLSEALSEIKWYLSDEGVHFYLNPYEIAPYSAGVIEVVIPL